MRLYATAIALTLAGLPTLAQTQAPASPAVSQPSAPDSSAAAPATGATAPATVPGSPRASRQTLQKRFEAANTTHDGHLTLEQAQAGLPHVARHFGAIDKDKKGYVTLDEIRHYYSQYFARRQRMNQASARSGSASTTTQ